MKKTAKNHVNDAQIAHQCRPVKKKKKGVKHEPKLIPEGLLLG